MGESLVEAPKIENKMGESFTHNPCLQESVSFGRFEHDSLCWERWSTFPTNKYLEEVEKCSTPGSVAQKKAYFEAHYKRIAARKAELLELEKNREDESMDSEDRTPLTSVYKTSEEDLDVEKPTTQNYVELDEVGNFTGEASDKHIDILSSSDDQLIQESEVNLTTVVSENFEENEVVNRTSGVSENFEENVVVNLTNVVSENFEENGVVNLTSEFSETFAENGVVNLTNELSENFDELSDVVDAIDEVADFTCEVNDHTDEMNGEAHMTEEKKKIQLEHIYEVHNGVDVVKDSQDIQPEPEDVNEDSGLKMEIPVLVKPDEPVLVKEDITSAQVWHDKEVLPPGKAEDKEITEEETPQPVKLVDPVKTKKTTLVKKATTNATNANRKPTTPISKRPVASTPKSPTTATPKSSKPELTKTAKSTTRPSVKKENGRTMTTKKAARPESKKVLPTSLHMSLSFGPTNSDPESVTTTRKSLIMERMGDKEIVKRAFKSFQIVSQLSPSSLAKPTATNLPATRTELKASAPDTPEKKKEGTIRSAKVASAVSGQQGTKKSLQSPGLKKNIGVDQRNGKVVPASFGSRSQDLGRQQKMVPKKEQKATIKDAGMTNLQPKSKAEKAAELGKPIHKINPKPKLSSSYNQGHGFLRGPVRKEAAKV